jgi:D-alanine-D-alanine ligase-like ATP-grasp enzyme
MYIQGIVGIVRGGDARERERSLVLGAALLRAFEDSVYDAVDIFVDEKGMWWKNGIAVEPSRALHTLAMTIPVFPGASPIASRIARLSEEHGVPYLGASPPVESVAHHLEGRAPILRQAGIHVPRTMSLRAYDAPTPEEIAYTIVRANPLPIRIITLPGDEYAHTRTPLLTVADIRDALTRITPGVRNVFIEEDVKGAHVTVYLIDGFRGEERYTFPAVPTLSGDPALWGREEGKNAESIARATADALSLEGFVRVDMTITPKKIVVRDVRTTPDLTPQSPLYDALERVGATRREIVDHIVRQVVGDTE